ncbi:hypothetical protein NHF48_019820 [Sphingomonas sp. H160509]|uniref:hypothetical protein n=1 Tax=Sphingomonas sp. H160509 TaxID=2955313 RepID=UPI002096D283|nr:hypothetical protein [Sphingomonas sp. H160509]MDD1452667.1 hypothetical protein [Sphingomonas sp. H160509]
MVGLTAQGATLAASSIANCEGHAYLHHFHRRCRDPRRGPVVNLEAWGDMTNGEPWLWYSLFHPGQIAAFTNRYFLGSGFTKSLAFKLFDEDGIEWETVSDMGTRPLRRRNARIVYYSDRPSSMWYFEGEAGQADLGMIAEHIAASTPAGSLFWSSNDNTKGAIERHLGADNYQRPRQAGTSLLMSYDTAAMFYAAKPSPQIEQAIRALGCEADDWIVSNEYEAVLQFVTRTSVRDVTSTRDVVLHVFNRAQAEYLKAFFDAQPHILATLDKVDLDLSTQTKKAPGRKPLVLSAEEREAKRLADKEKRKLAMRDRRAPRIPREFGSS